MTRTPTEIGTAGLITMLSITSTSGNWLFANASALSRSFAACDGTCPAIVTVSVSKITTRGSGVPSGLVGYPGDVVSGGLATLGGEVVGLAVSTTGTVVVVVAVVTVNSWVAAASVAGAPSVVTAAVAVRLTVVVGLLVVMGALEIVVLSRGTSVVVLGLDAAPGRLVVRCRGPEIDRQEPENSSAEDQDRPLRDVGTCGCSLVVVRHSRLFRSLCSWLFVGKWWPRRRAHEVDAAVRIRRIPIGIEDRDCSDGGTDVRGRDRPAVHGAGRPRAAHPPRRAQFQSKPVPVYRSNRSFSMT